MYSLYIQFTNVWYTLNWWQWFEWFIEYEVFFLDNLASARRQKQGTRVDTGRRTEVEHVGDQRRGRRHAERDSIDISTEQACGLRSARGLAPIRIGPIGLLVFRRLCRRRAEARPGRVRSTAKRAMERAVGRSGLLGACGLSVCCAWWQGDVDRCGQDQARGPRRHDA